MPKWSMRFALSLCVAAASAACGSDGKETTEIPTNVCEHETRAPKYSAGIEFTGARGVTLRIIDSMPAPPKMGDNRWLIELEGPDGMPIDDAEFDIRTWMPDHMHMDPIAIGVNPMGNGQYGLDPVNFQMKGYWEDTFKITKGDLVDSPMVKICVLP